MMSTFMGGATSGSGFSYGNKGRPAVCMMTTMFKLMNIGQLQVTQEVGHEGDNLLMVFMEIWIPEDMTRWASIT